MHKQDLITIAGGTGKLARVLGVTSQAVSMWPQRLSRRQAHEVIGAFVAHGRYAEIRHLVETAAQEVANLEAIP